MKEEIRFQYTYQSLGSTYRCEASFTARTASKQISNKAEMRIDLQISISQIILKVLKTAKYIQYMVLTKILSLVKQMLFSMTNKIR